MVLGYIDITSEGEKAYVKADALHRIAEVDAVIFDCDGVLIDVRASYNRAIAETVAYIAGEILKLADRKNLVSRDVIYLFKRSGGFNNDWDVAYVITLYILSRLPTPLKTFFKKLIDTITFRNMDSVKERFDYVREGIAGLLQSSSTSDATRSLRRGLTGFARYAGPSGISPLEERLRTEDEKTFHAIKAFLRYPGPVGVSLLTTIFEEKFCGEKLFRSVYGVEPEFHMGQGLIDREEIIVTSEALRSLAKTINSARFGIASGRPHPLAEYTLDGLLSEFVPEALVFLGVVEQEERRLKTPLKKPHPFSLLRSYEALCPCETVLYVGDSIEDSLMVDNANKIESRFLSAGVYRHSDSGKNLLSDFLEAWTDLIVPSANELPTLLKTVKEERLRA